MIQAHYFYTDNNYTFSLLSFFILFIHRWLTYTSTTTVNESRRVCGWLRSLVTRDLGPWFVPPYYYCRIVFLPYCHIDILKFSTVPFTDSQSWRGRYCWTKKWFFDQQRTDERVLRSHILCALGCIVKHTVTRLEVLFRIMNYESSQNSLDATRI